MLNFVESVISFLESPFGFIIGLFLYGSLLFMGIFNYISYLRRNKNDRRGDNND